MAKSIAPAEFEESHRDGPGDRAALAGHSRSGEQIAREDRVLRDRRPAAECSPKCFSYRCLWLFVAVGAESRRSERRRGRPGGSRPRGVSRRARASGILQPPTIPGLRQELRSSSRNGR